MSDEEEEPEYALVMPFIVCQSQGGPYEDNAFVAGARYGAMRALMDTGITGISTWEPTDLVPQLDLLSMDRGYIMLIEPWEEHPEEWTRVTMMKGSASDSV